MRPAVDDLAEYYGVIHREFRTTKLGCIRSLGFFEVASPGAMHYQRTVPALPKWPFDRFLDTLLAAMRRRGVELDHFHIDFGYEGVRHDDGGQGRLDYGRIRSVEAAARARGVKAGVIVNAFHDTAQQAPERQAANRQACEHTVSFFDGYLAVGGPAEHPVLQSWQSYPDGTGPVGEPDTVLWLAKTLLERVR